MKNVKFYTDGYDTYAAECIEDIKKEQIKAGVISEEDFEPSDWKEVSPANKMWCCPIEDIDPVRMVNDIIYMKNMMKEYSRTLLDVYISGECEYKSETGKAIFMCSTEY